MSARGKMITCGVWVVLLIGLWTVAPVGAETPVPAGQDYVVKSGDTLALIARRFLGEASRFSEIVVVTNEKHAADSTYAHIQDAGAIEVGWKLFVPGSAASPGSDKTPARIADQQPVKADPPATPGGGTDPARGKIAFSLYNLGREVYEVQIVNLGTGERWIVTDQESVSEPALSPDGQRIAVRGWDRYRGIETFDLYGKNQQGVSGQLEDSRPNWGSGDSIILGSQRESDRRWRLYKGGADNEIKWINNDKLVESLVGEAPAWSPDGSYIVYRGCDFSLNGCGIRTIARSPGQPQILTLESSDASPHWSPDGRTIVFMSKRSGNWDLYTLPVDAQGRLAAGAEPKQIATDASNECLPAWSPWGDALAFVSDRSGAWAVYIMRPDGSDVRKIADIGGTYDPPLWAPEVGGRGVTNEQISWSK